MSWAYLYERKYVLDMPTINPLVTYMYIFVRPPTDPACASVAHGIGLRIINIERIVRGDSQIKVFKSAVIFNKNLQIRCVVMTLRSCILVGEFRSHHPSPTNRNRKSLEGQRKRNTCVTCAPHCGVFLDRVHP